MKKLYIEIFSAFLLMVLMALVLEYLYKDYVNDFDLRFKAYDEEKDIIEQIYIGNSHIGVFGFMSDSNETIFNFSFGGQDLFHMMVLIEKAISGSPSLKSVVLGCDYDLLGYNYQIANQNWKDRQYYPHTGVLFDKSLSNLIMAKSNFFRSNRDLKHLFASSKNKNQNEQKINFIPIQTGNLSKDGCKKRAEEHSFVKYKEELIDENIHCLKRIANSCNEKNVSLIIVNPPKRKCYWNSYNEEVIKYNSETLIKMSEELGFVFIDFYNNAEFIEGDFLDYDHLNKKGALKLLEMIE
jgi:hypothetical protein